MKTISMITLASLLTLPLTLSAQQKNKQKEEHQEVKIVIKTDDNGNEKENIQVIVMQDSVINIRSGKNGKIENNINVDVKDDKGVIRVNIQEDGKEPQSIVLDLENMVKDLEVITEKQVSKLDEKEINRILEKYLPGLEHMEDIGTDLEREMELMEAELEKLGDNIKFIHINGTTDTIINKISATEDGKTIKTLVVVKTRVNMADFTEEEWSKIKNREKQKAGINELKVDQLNFYPNPSDGQFTVNFNSAEKGNLNITVTDMEGKTVYTERVPDFTGTYNKQYNLSGLKNGIYVLKMEIGGKSHFKKMMID